MRFSFDRRSRGDASLYPWLSCADPFGVGASYNEAMKRRRWWFIGLALALLAACVFCWKWRERPPYKFMEGAVITDFFVGGGSTVIEFRSSKGIQALKARADAEMIPRGWEKVPSRRPTMDVRLAITSARVRETLPAQIMFGFLIGTQRAL